MARLTQVVGSTDLVIDRVVDSPESSHIAISLRAQNGKVDLEGKVVEQSKSEAENSFVVDDFDRDSLHTLPLSMIPLETSGLKRALMIKNARYEGVVELFKAEGSGSGQVEVGQLANVFNNIAESDLRVQEQFFVRAEGAR